MSTAQNFVTDSEWFNLKLLKNNEFILTTNFDGIKDQHIWVKGIYELSDDSIICRPSGFIEATAIGKYNNSDSVVIEVRDKSRRKVRDFYLNSKLSNNLYYSDSSARCFIRKCELIENNNFLLGVPSQNGYCYKVNLKLDSTKNYFYFELENRQEFYGSVLNDVIFLITIKKDNKILELKLLSNEEIGIKDFTFKEEVYLLKLQK